MTERLCVNCIFFEPMGSPDPNAGQCRINEPKASIFSEVNLYSDMKVLETVWPIVKYRDWCGKFRMSDDSTQIVKGSKLMEED